MKVACKIIAALLILFLFNAPSTHSTTQLIEWDSRIVPFVLEGDSLKINNLKINIKPLSPEFVYYKLSYDIEGVSDSDTIRVLFSNLTNIKSFSLNNRFLSLDSIYAKNKVEDSIYTKYYHNHYGHPRNNDDGKGFFAVLEKGINNLNISFEVETECNWAYDLKRFSSSFDVNHLKNANHVGNITILAEPTETNEELSIFINDSVYSIASTPFELKLSEIPSHIEIRYNPKGNIHVIDKCIIGLFILLILFALSSALIIRKTRKSETFRWFRYLLSISLIIPIVWILCFYIGTHIIHLLIGEYSSYSSSFDIFYAI